MITETGTAKIGLDLKSLVLSKGFHENRDNGMCAMEAVALLAGEVHSDRPSCACPTITEYVRGLNDRLSNENRQYLRKFIPRLVGSNRNKQIEEQRLFVMADAAVRNACTKAVAEAGMPNFTKRFSAFTPIVDRATATEAKKLCKAALLAATHLSRTSPSAELAVPRAAARVTLRSALDALEVSMGPEKFRLVAGSYAAVALTREGAAFGPAFAVLETMLSL